MAKVTDEIKAYSVKLDEVTDKIAASVTAVGDRIQKLIDSTDSGLTEEAKALLQARVDELGTVAAALEPLGKDPANPVPESAPEPPPA